jgi:hypothetical protein
MDPATVTVVAAIDLGLMESTESGVSPKVQRQHISSSNILCLLSMIWQLFGPRIGSFSLIYRQNAEFLQKALRNS